MPLFVLAMIAKTPDRSTVNWTPMEIGWNEGRGGEEAVSKSILELSRCETIIRETYRERFFGDSFRSDHNFHRRYRGQ